MCFIRSTKAITDIDLLRMKARRACRSSRAGKLCMLWQAVRGRVRVHVWLRRRACSSRCTALTFRRRGFHGGRGILLAQASSNTRPNSTIARLVSHLLRRYPQWRTAFLSLGQHFLHALLKKSKLRAMLVNEFVIWTISGRHSMRGLRRRRKVQHRWRRTHANLDYGEDM